MEQCALNSYVEMWGKPLSEDAPCGEDSSFSPEFEALRAEVDKDSSLHATDATDWGLVARLAAEFLAAQSKDLWVLVYAVFAEYRVRGLDACPPAFAALSHLLQQYWDSMYPLPKRMQRRLAPLVWLCSRMEHSAEKTCFMDGSVETSRALKEEFAVIQKILDEKVGEDAPHFSGIFSRIPETISTSAEKEPPASQPAAQTSPQSSARAAAPVPIAASLAEMDKDGRVPAGVLPQLVRNIADQARQLAGHFLSLNALDERAYQLHRTALWSTLLQLPQADVAGKTQLTSGVPADRIQAYAAAVEGKQYSEILPHLERSAGKAPFWFDGHSMVVRCLDGLGAPAAAACVREALADLLKRFPELLNYKFRDNTPFASAKILPWLENLRTPATEGNVASGLALGGTASGDADEGALLQEAITCNMEEGFQAGLRRLGTVPAGRSRAAVLHGLMQARYCLAVGKKNAAVQLLSALYIQMEEWNLLDWEPDLTARILALLLSAQPKQRGGKMDDMIRRLHWLNLDTALSILHET